MRRLALLAAALAFSATAWGQAKGAQLITGHYLKTNEYLQGQNKTAFAIMQGDGNFCVYLGSGPADNKGVVWCANKQSHKRTNYHVVMQSDGNLCIYMGKDPQHSEGNTWCSGVLGPKGAAYTLDLTRQGIYVTASNGPSDNTRRWRKWIWGSYPQPQGISPD